MKIDSREERWRELAVGFGQDPDEFVRLLQEAEEANAEADDDFRHVVQVTEWFPEPWLMESVERCGYGGYCFEHGPDNLPSWPHHFVFRPCRCEHCGEIYDWARGCVCPESQVCPFAEEPE